MLNEKFAFERRFQLPENHIDDFTPQNWLQEMFSTEHRWNEVRICVEGISS